MNTGASWSGRERHCAFLNLQDNTFVDISAVAQLDFLDDGRALAVTDWDGDGDLDLWLRNRTGPQLRFMRNDDASGHHWVALKLRGKTCNHDAIGARVEIFAGGKRLVRELRAGDGYMAQSSKWMHFGLGTADRIDKIVVRWPGAETQTLDGPEVDRRYKLTQGASEFATVAPRNITIKAAPAPDVKTPSATRVVLRVPLPLSSSLLEKLQPAAPSDDRPRLINLWAHWCAPCVAELTEFAKHAGQFNAANLSLVLRSVDKPEDHTAARRLFKSKILPFATKDASPGEATDFAFETIDKATLDVLDALIGHVLNKPGKMALPTSLLVDKNGQIQIIYLGPVSTKQLLADAATYGQHPEQHHDRSPFPGRWYYGMKRNFRGLAKDLLDRGHRKEAQHFARLWKQRQKRTR